MIGAIGDREHVANLGLEGFPGVDHLTPITKPYKLSSLQFKKGERTVLDIGGRKIGGEHFMTIAGPCTVESRDQMLDTARYRQRRGRAAPARRRLQAAHQSPYSFHGLGQAGLKLLAEAKEETGLPIVTECMDVRDLEAVVEVADVIQLGARNMQNYTLLTEVGRAGKPVLLKRGLSSHAGGAADGLRVHPQGGQRGRDAVRARHPHVRDGLPLHPRPDGRAGAARADAPADRRSTRATPPDRRDLVLPLSLAAAAIGADGIIVETHPEPEAAICDGPQQLYADRVRGLPAPGRGRRRSSRARSSPAATV